MNRGLSRTGRGLKVILSRKGFDAASGGVPNAIMPDGRLVPFPIPAPSDPATYTDVVINGVSIGTLVEELTGGKVGRARRCHLDPDIDAGSRTRIEGWLPCLGQIDAAQGHLAKQGVSEGDLFLFFGWFRQVEKGAFGWRYLPGAPDLHLVYGWLRIGQIVRLGCGERPQPVEAFSDHPHLQGRERASNTLYLASNSFGIADVDAPGAGLFGRVSESRILTDRSQKSRSVWRLPAWMHPDRGSTLTYHLAPKRWRMDGDACTVRCVGRGQEFVLRCGNFGAMAEWVRGLFDE